MAKITGLGGVFFKTKDPEELYKWYEEILGIKRDNMPCIIMSTDGNDSKGESGNKLVWSIFNKSSDYFNNEKASFMINYRVDNL